jgi:hypothetical protein
MKRGERELRITQVAVEPNRSEPASIAFNRCNVHEALFFASFRIRFTAIVAKFFVDEENSTDGAFRLVSDGLQRANHFYGLHDAGAIVVSAFANVP